MLQIVVSLTNDVIYEHNIFIIQATTGLKLAQGTRERFLTINWTKKTGIGSHHANMLKIKGVK